jgi:opacity protein-like surface antigen
MKRLALPVCAAVTLAAGAAAPVYGAEQSWYVGTGAGYSKADIKDEAIDKTVDNLVPGATTTSVVKNDDSIYYRLFLGYSFTSFLALEAHAFRLGEFGFDANTTAGKLSGQLGVWGGSLDLLGIIPFGDSWRVFGRVGGIVAKSTLNYEGLGNPPSDEATKWGWKAGAGIGYEFESGVGFRGEYEYFSVDTAAGEKLKTHVISGSVLYRFK